MLETREKRETRGTSFNETSAQRRLEELQASHGLPAACKMAEVFLHRVKVGALDLCMVGLVAGTSEAASVTGAAAAEHGFPIDRAFFELLERLSIFAARSSPEPLRIRDRSGAVKGTRAARLVFPSDKKPDTLRASLSNGVALHSAWPLACDAAQAELIERDRVLRSFAGEYAPAPIPEPDATLARALRADYEVSAYTFGPKRKQLEHVASGLFLFPRRASAPLVYGFGAATSVVAALAAAKREALQRLAFLWGEELPSVPPAAAPLPDYHQEYYLYPPHHSILRQWLAGKRGRPQPKSTKHTETNRTLDRDARFVDLTMMSGKGGLVVAKAISPKACSLRFGLSSTESRAGSPPHPIA
jgi:hypothetical protein